MTNTLHKQRKAHLKGNAQVDKVLEEYYEREFSEFVVRSGGDVCVYRVYGTPENFKVYER